MPSPRRRTRRTRNAPQIRREQIIDEAIRIIGRRGYYGFGLQELAQRCGLSKAGLLYHFQSKDQLLSAVIEVLERREIQVMGPLAAQASARPSAASVMNVLQTMVARGITEPELARFYTIMYSESLHPEHPAHAAFRARQAKVLDLFAKVLAPYVAKPRMTARQLFALLQGLALQWHRENQSFDVVAAWGLAITTLVPGLAASQQRRPRAAANLK